MEAVSCGVNWLHSVSQMSVVCGVLPEEVGGLGLGFEVSVDVGNLVVEDFCKVVTEFL